MKAYLVALRSAVVRLVSAATFFPRRSLELPAFELAGAITSQTKGSRTRGVRLTRVAAIAQVLAPLIALAVVGCTNLPEPRTPSQAVASLQHNRQLGERYFERVWNKGEVDVLDELLTADYINHTPSTPNPPRGPAGLKPIVRAIREGFPDLKYEIQDMVITSDRVVMRVVMTGTNTGPLFGKPASGRAVRVNQINIEEIRNGRIAEHWRVTDEAELQRQLGY
jgi:steroid delta-isomerase-like uncharacterized protein